ncbi:hypothetical protein [Oleiharenicola lentus]|uniref:hypothetical protein n=1 Tax=Oleiharenicola lentus TaxID=2508720 RepID=UPI003F67E59B
MKISIKALIWLYLTLLIFEGALRKWVLPGMADALLVVRDPVILAIYVIAFKQRIFPINRFIAAIAVLAGLSVLLSVLGGHTHPLVIAYGVRINYFHLPLIWIMGAVLDRRDVERIGAFLLIVGIPMTLVMVEQFRSPMNAYINRGIGNDEVGQIFGADGRIRPPGLFAFITGPQLFYPLCAAFFLDEISGAKRLPWYLLVVCGLTLAIALPVSISRSLMLGTGVVAVAFVLSRPFTSVKASVLFRPLLLLAVVGTALSQLPVFREGAEVFMMRWDTAEGEGAAVAWGGVLNRTVNGFTNPAYFLKIAPLLGHGIGSGSNVGARLTSGEVGFNLAEEEWGKVLLELGPLVGSGFIIFRIILTGWLGWVSWRALRRDRNALPLLIFAAMALTILQGQWAPPTVLGFAVTGAGLLLGACNPRRDDPGAKRKTDESSALISHPSLHHRGIQRAPSLTPRRLPSTLHKKNHENPIDR